MIFPGLAKEAVRIFTGINSTGRRMHKKLLMKIHTAYTYFQGILSGKCYFFRIYKITITMEHVSLNGKTFKTFIGYDTIMKAIDEVAAKINADYRDSKDVPVLLCVLNGSIMFMAELMKRLEFNLEVVSIKLTSYSGTSSTGKVRQAMGLTGNISGRNVIIVEDIVDTGNTIVELKRILKEYGAREIRVCTMLLKPEIYSKDEKLDYVALPIPNRFIVGFGLDYDELGRNLKDIYVLDED